MAKKHRRKSHGKKRRSRRRHKKGPGQVVSAQMKHRLNRALGRKG